MEEPNLLYIKKLSKGDLAFEANILDILKEELQEDINNYHHYLKLKDYQKTKIYIHRIKHKMSILGLEKSYEITNAFENDIRDLNFENQDYFEKVLPGMLHFLEKI